jgi:hypothetical protein
VFRVGENAEVMASWAAPVNEYWKVNCPEVFIPKYHDKLLEDRTPKPAMPSFAVALCEVK